jgi:hypothetical protein
VTPSPFSRLASATVTGLVSIAAQTWAGVKTFTSAIIASAGIQVGSLFNTNGGSGSDIAVRLGTTLADGSMNSGATLLSLRSGIGATEVEHLNFKRLGGINGGAAALALNNSLGARLDFGVNFLGAVPTGVRLQAGLGGGDAVVSAANGGSASDVGVKVGVSTADGSVNATAKLLSVRTGIGGTEVEKLAVLKSGRIVGDGGAESSAGSTVVQLSELFWSALRGGRGFFINQAGSGAVQMYTNVGSFTGIEVIGDISFAVANVFVAKVATGGRFDQSGTDSSGTPGAATINKPTGISAIASGSATVVITNSLATTTSRILITWHGDHGQTRDWVVRAAGSFTVTLNAAASANTAFSWEVSSIL